MAPFLSDLAIHIRSASSALLQTPQSPTTDPGAQIQKHQILTPQESSSSDPASETSNDLPDTSDDSGTEEEEDTVPTLSLHAAHEARRRKEQNAAFDQFVQAKDDETRQEVLKQIRSPHFEEGRKIIESARDYQTELFARAKAENIITVLDTGSGKTLIAALLLKYMVSKELDDRAANLPPRTSFFLANSVALVEQQHQMLCNNLASPPANAHGKIVDSWTRERWAELLTEFEVVVCTAEILYQCLNRNFLKIEDINLIIFDEAHHAKKEHPYSRIMKDHYFTTPKDSLRPKIFGTTASPVDGKADVLFAADGLEKILDAKIVTTKSLSLNTYAPKAAVEEWEYETSPLVESSFLHGQLKTCRRIPEFESYFMEADHVRLELGTWCSDQVWRYAHEDKKFAQILQKCERSSNATQKAVSIETIKETEEIVKSHDFWKGFDSLLLNTNPKVVLLRQKLEHYFGQNENTKCLIFVDERIKARILCDLFTWQKVGSVRPGVFLGMGRNKSGHTGMTGPQFRELRSKFEAGVINCLFCTSVAEEGIDSPECNLVIRFDLYHTMIQYVQSRGRARAHGSVYGQMIEKTSWDHKIRIDQAREHETDLRRFLESLDDDRFLESNYITLQGALDAPSVNKRFNTPSGAMCSYRTSISILERYAASLQYKGATDSRVVYEADISNGLFRFRTVLSDVSPLHGATGDAATDKRTAKQSAAWFTCLKLRQLAELDDELDSIHLKMRPENANAKLAVSEFKKKQYERLPKPRFWTKDCGTAPERLYANIIHLVPSTELKRQHDPLVLLTRSQTPSFPDFPVYLDDNVETKVAFVQNASPYAANEHMLKALKKSTFQVFLELFNKRYEADDSQIPYWIAPSRWRPGRALPDKLEDLVALESATDLEPLSWSTGQSSSLWCERFLIDQWSGEYRYWSKSKVEGHNIKSRIPGNLPQRMVKVEKEEVVDGELKKSWGRGKAETVEGYTFSIYGKSREERLAKFDQTQPVLRAELVPTRRDFLDIRTSSGKEKSEFEYHICPEPLKASMLPHGFICTALVFPSIMSRMDAYLIALELGEKLGLELDLALALEAITKDEDHTEEHHANQVHVQRGMGKNYEREEFLGDSWLKLCTSLSVFILYPRCDEFFFHAKRMAMICNRNLCNVGLSLGVDLPKYVRTQGFSRRNWYPEGMKLKGGRGSKDAEDQPVVHKMESHDLADKTLADVIEALIGAALLSCDDRDSFDLAVRAVSRLVDSPDHDVTSWADYSRLYEPPSWSLDTSPDGFTYGPHSFAEKIQTRMGYRFKHPRLLRSAMTHPSVQNKNVPDYQRLEFLGDAAFDMVCIRYLFDRFPDRNPQWLTEHKMAMVSNKFLGALAVDLGLHKFLEFGGTAVGSQIAEYAAKVIAVLKGAKDSNQIDFWTEISDPPKALSDAVEAYIGALFVDSNFNYQEIEKFFTDHVLWYFSDMEVYDSFANKHPTTELTNILSKQFHCRHAVLRPREKPSAIKDGRRGLVVTDVTVMIHNEVLTSEEGESLRYAKVRASKKALSKLKGMSREEFQSRFRCDCKGEEAADGPSAGSKPDDSEAKVSSRGENSPFHDNNGIDTTPVI